MNPDVYRRMFTLEDEHWWFAGRRAYLSKLLDRFLRSRSGLLCEIGCGTGGNLSMATKYGEVHAVEMEEQAIELAKSRNLPAVSKIVRGHLPEDIPLDSLYDCVLALDVIEHVEQDVAALARLGALTKARGLVVITVPAYQWLWSAHDVANHHKRRYTKASLLSTMKTAGLNVSYCSYFNSLLFPVAVLGRLWGSLFATNKSRGQAHWDVALPTDVVNKALAATFRAESIGAGRWSIPFGLSIAAVAQRSSEAQRR